MRNSKDYFAEVANNWDQMRSGFFTETMRDAAIADAKLEPGALVADVGTGTGFMIDGLARRAAFVFGFDESPEMVAVARKNLSGYPNVRLRQAEGLQLPMTDGWFDAVFTNMYLHHTPDPAAAIAEMARLLKPGSGKLVIIDLESHNQEWMRNEMADRWLGFHREDIRTWYRAAGLGNIVIDCAKGTCQCTGTNNEHIALSVFVAIGERI